MAEEPKQRSHPTVGPSDDVDEGARLFFESWLPLRWKKRKQVPDIHVDYRVELVENGEPSGLHFQAQVKGRSIHKRKAKNLAEPIKTKHLRYYLRCEEPVFLFLIDPVGKEANLFMDIFEFLKGFLVLNTHSFHTSASRVMVLAGWPKLAHYLLLRQSLFAITDAPDWPPAPAPFSTAIGRKPRQCRGLFPGARW
jgi:hypothetical protein